MSTDAELGKGVRWGPVSSWQQWPKPRPYPQRTAQRCLADPSASCYDRFTGRTPGPTIHACECMHSRHPAAGKGQPSQPLHLVLIRTCCTHAQQASCSRKGTVVRAVVDCADQAMLVTTSQCPVLTSCILFVLSTGRDHDGSGGEVRDHPGRGG